MRRLTFLFIIFVLGCQPDRTPSTSFYYWKTVFQLSPEEKAVLTTNNVNRLYIRYCDVVVKNDEAKPESPIIFAASPGDIKVIPVVYIKNEVMLNDNIDVTKLAEKLTSFIQQINTVNTIQTNELQIDCDWTEQSKNKYFEFLELIQSKSNMTVSATIRLHQVKYPERTGVPPVQKGVLMYYNMGRISVHRSNSIYDKSIALRYLDRLAEYPINLDVALPIFVWGVHIRDNKVIGLLRDVDAETFYSDNHFEMLASPFFETNESTFKKGYHFQKGDRIKIESISRDDLQEMLDDLKQKIKSKPAEVIFYDLDKFNLKQFDHDDHIFEEISADF
jgi:hypothetical protein